MHEEKDTYIQHWKKQTKDQSRPGWLIHDDIMELVDVRELLLLHLSLEDAPQILNRV